MMNLADVIMFQDVDAIVCDPDFEICPEIPDFPEDELEVIEAPEKEPLSPPEPWEGRYYGWMLAPAVMVLGSSVTLADQFRDQYLCRAETDSFPWRTRYESNWWYTVYWGYGAAVTSVVWFHELYRGGPEQHDKVFGFYNEFAIAALLGQFGLTLWSYSTREDDSAECNIYPISFMANSLQVIVGAALTYLTFYRNAVRTGYRNAYIDSITPDAPIVVDVPEEVDTIEEGDDIEFEEPTDDGFNEPIF